MRAFPRVLKCRADKPQNCVQAEKSQNNEQQQIHKPSSKIKRRKGFPVARTGVRMVGDKARARAVVALTASRRQIGGCYRGVRIRSGKDGVFAMAIPTMGGGGVPER